jgi:Zn-dependent protease with chaperone function
MTAIEPALKYPGISAQGFAHPADRAATAALHSVPMFDKLIKRMSEFRYERKLRQLFLGQAIRLGEDQLPAVWGAQQLCANTLDIERSPRLYVTQQPVGNAMTIGTHEPVTLVASGLVSGWPESELRSVLAHEMGHVLADHVALTTAFELVSSIVQGAFRAQPLAGVPLLGLYYALLEWSRAAELTADRASALVIADPLVPCRTLMRMAGGPLEGLSLDAFIRQATEYASEDDPFARWSRFFSEVRATHPFPVRRVRELIGWVTVGDYDRVRSGQYLRRGQEPPATAEFEIAYRHYRERFTRIVERAGTSIQSVADKVNSWFDGFDRSGEEGAPA